MKARFFFLVIVALLCGIEYVGYYLSRGYSVLIACMIFMAVNVFYTIIAKARYRKRSTPYVPDFKPFVSMIVPAKNEEKVIADTVREMMKVVYHNSDGTPNYELMVIDDASTDRTLDILKELQNEYPNLRVHHRDQVPNPSKAAVLNDVLDICKGEIQAIFDADARISPNFLQRIIPYMYDPKVGGVQAQKTISNADVNWLTGAQEDELIMLMSIGENQDLAEGAVDMRGNGMIVKRSAVKDVGGWNEKALTEDLDMSARLHLNKWDVRYCPDIAVMEEAVVSVKALYKQRKRWAEGGIRRYLDYLPEFFEPNTPLVKKLDMFAFFLAIYLPIWLFIGLLFSIFGSIQSGELKIAVVVYFSVLLAIVLMINTFIGLRNSGLRKKRRLFYRTIRSTLFNAHWLIVMPIVSFKILFQLKPTAWVKTEHHGAGDHSAGVV
jgi:1,2-diacylglycerol 3-beta-glucosyltransferase